MNPWTNHTVGLAQHREYEQRYGNVDHPSPPASNRRFRLLHSLWSVLTAWAL